MKIGVLTSSRADFGIYLPLLKKLTADNFFDVQIIAFATHLSKYHGYTIDEIESAGFKNITPISTKVIDGDAHSIAMCYSDVVEKFTAFWNIKTFDLVLCLGDRYEMSAAVQASIPYGVKLAHFHGGEMSLGAIDNIYRHQISLASRYHFTATDEFAARVRELLDENKQLVFSVGSMSLSDLDSLPLLTEIEFREKYQLPDTPYILCTFHPETNDADGNETFASDLIEAFKQVSDTIHLLVSMPNADTNGSAYRNRLISFAKLNPQRITLVQSFGKTNYFSAMNFCEFVIGNSSSGIIEAATFGKYSINVGNRQKGRLQSGNIIDIPFETNSIYEAISNLMANPRTFSGKNKYVQSNTLEKIIQTLRSIGNGEL